METTLNIATKGLPTTAYVAPQVQHTDSEVPTVKPATASATLPADKVFVAQVVSARLLGTAYPENPAEIAPEERTLKPYNVPMLPSGEQKTVPKETPRDSGPNSAPLGDEAVSVEGEETE